METLDAYFRYDSLPSEQQPIAAQYKALADAVVVQLHSGSQRTAALQSLLDSRAAALRTFQAKAGL